MVLSRFLFLKQAQLEVYLLIWVILPQGTLSNSGGECSSKAITILAIVSCVGLLLIAMSIILAVWCVKRYSSSEKQECVLQADASQPPEEEYSMSIYSNSFVDDDQPDSLKVLVDNDLYEPGPTPPDQEDFSDKLNVYESVT